MDKKASYKVSNRWIFGSLIVIGIIGSLVLVYALIEELYSIARADWLNVLFVWISSVATVFLGVIALRQNEWFRIINEEEAEKIDNLKNKHQEDILTINNRLLEFEECKQKSFLGIVQNRVIVCNSDEVDDYALNIGKTYRGFFRESLVRNYKGTTFVFEITNQTDVPIKSFTVDSFSVGIIPIKGGWGATEVKTCKNGGDVSYVELEKGERATYKIEVPGIVDLGKKLKEDEGLLVKLVVNVTSIYDRHSKQPFTILLISEPSSKNEKSDTVFNIFTWTNKIEGI